MLGTSDSRPFKERYSFFDVLVGQSRGFLSNFAFFAEEKLLGYVRLFCLRLLPPTLSTLMWEVMMFSVKLLSR